MAYYLNKTSLAHPQKKRPILQALRVPQASAAFAIFCAVLGFFHRSACLRPTVRLGERVEGKDDHRTQIYPGHLEMDAKRNVRAAIPRGYHLVCGAAPSALRLSRLFAATR